MQDVRIERMRLDALRAAPYNPREISDDAMKGLGTSIDRFGMVKPIVWNERTGHIVGGHQRHRHLMNKGVEETDVVVVSLSDDEEMALNIALNSRTIRGEFSDEAVDVLSSMSDELGEALAGLRLDVLKKRLERYAGSDVAGSDDVGDEGHDLGGGGFEDDGVGAVITCPECHSRWRMSDEKVIHDATT